MSKRSLTAPRLLSLFCLGLLLVAAGCGDDTNGTTDSGVLQDSSTQGDTGIAQDQGTDSGAATVDSGTADSGVSDSGPGDAGLPPDGCSGTLQCTGIQDMMACAATPGCSFGSSGCQGTASIVCAQLNTTPRCVDSGCTWRGDSVCQVGMTCNPDEVCCGTMCIQQGDTCMIAQ